MGLPSGLNRPMSDPDLAEKIGPREVPEVEKSKILNFSKSGFWGSLGVGKAPKVFFFWIFRPREATMAPKRPLVDQKWPKIEKSKIAQNRFLEVP